MNFLAPLGLLFALFLPAVILLYLLKLKRMDINISSTLLWRQSVEDLKANTPFQKLKRNLLLFLQLLIIALLTLAVARPVLELGGLKGQSFIVLIDNSASMGASDVEPNRLENAKRKAIDLVNDMSMGDRMMVVSFSDGAQVLCPFEQDKGTLRSVIQSIEVTDTRTGIEEALRIAKTAADKAANPELIIFSDGQFIIPAQSPLARLNTRYVPIGLNSDNLGITDFVIRKDFALEQNYQLLVGIQNFSSEEKTAYLELYGEGYVLHPEEGEENGETETIEEESNEEEAHLERRLMDARQFTLEPRTANTIIFKDEGYFPEKIEVVLDSDDALETDNHAWAIIPREDTINILLVTNGNAYLQQVFNLDPRVQLTQTTPGGAVAQDQYDIIVFDSHAPPALIEGNYVFINALPPLPEWSAGEEIENPMLVDWDRFHPITRHLNLDNLSISKCRNIGTPPWIEVIVESRQTPLLAAFQQENVKGLVTAFDIYDSNWPMLVSFPIFFTNSIDWFVTEHGPSSLMKRTGDILTLEATEQSSKKIEIVPPPPLKPTKLTFQDNAPVFFGGTTKTGIYQFTIDDEVHKQYAINLLSSEESQIEPKGSLKVEETQEIEGEITAVESNQEIWRWLAVLGLLVLIFEWYVYVKRARYAF